MSNPDPTRVEQYIGEYDRVKLAVAFDWDEQRVTRIKSLWDELDWQEHHHDRSDEYEFADGTVEFTYTVDRSSTVLRRLRETVRLGIPPAEEIPWNVDVYPTAPGDDPRECEACGESAVLGARGLAAMNMHNSAEWEVLDSDLTDAEQVCRLCGQFYEYLVRDDPDPTPETVGESMQAHEVM